MLTKGLGGWLGGVGGGQGDNSCVSVNNVCLSGLGHVSLSFCVCVCLLDVNLNLRQAARHHLCTRGNEFSAFMAVEQARPPPPIDEQMTPIV